MNTQQIVQLPIYVLNKCCFAATTGRVNERMAYVHVVFLYSICMKPLRLVSGHFVPWSFRSKSLRSTV